MPAKIGSNSFSKSTLKEYLDRLEKLADEKAAISEDQRELMQEIKSNGFDTKMVRQMLKLRTMDPGEREEFLALFDMYASIFD